MALKNARIFAIVLVIVGLLLFWLGIADQLVGISVGVHLYLGIWIGMWMVITGGLGILGTRNEPSTSRNAFVATFHCLSFISAMLGMGLFLLYSFATAIYIDYPAQIAFNAIYLVTGILGCCAGCGVLTVICCCSTSPPQLQGGQQGGQPQAVYRTATVGYQPQRIDMPSSYEEGQYVRHLNQQASSGAPVAVQLQSGATFVADETVTTEAQDNQPQIVLLPDSREMDDPPPPYEAVTLDYQTLQFDIPPSYEEAGHGQCKTYV